MRAFFLLMFATALGLPAKDELMFDAGDDTAVVESTVREARAAVPEHIEEILEPGVKEAFFHSYGDEEDADGDGQGYHKKSEDKGNDGYQHFDSYHKKDGDKYGYETHSEYGQANKGGADGDGKSQKYTEGYDDDHEGNAEYHGGEAETKKLYQVVENVNENKNVKAVEDYEGDAGFYADSGDNSEAHIEGGESDAYIEEGGEEADSGYDGGDGESEHYAEHDGDSEVYTEYDENNGEAESFDEY